MLLAESEFGPENEIIFIFSRNKNEYKIDFWSVCSSKFAGWKWYVIIVAGVSCIIKVSCLICFFLLPIVNYIHDNSSNRSQLYSNPPVDYSNNSSALIIFCNIVSYCDCRRPTIRLCWWSKTPSAQIADLTLLYLRIHPALPKPPSKSTLLVGLIWFDLILLLTYSATNTSVTFLWCCNVLMCH